MDGKQLSRRYSKTNILGQEVMKIKDPLRPEEKRHIEE